MLGREQFKQLKCLHGKLVAFLINNIQKSTCTGLLELTEFLYAN